jgi:tetrapyrrole methylase family protein / MazG family protein
MSEIVVVGLGPAGPDLLTAGSLSVLENAKVLFARTLRHPCASVLVGAQSFDDVYESHATFDDVYNTIVDTLLTQSIVHGTIVYAVPGSPVVAERTVELLRQRGPSHDVSIRLIPALSFLDLAWVRLGIDPMAMRVTVVDAQNFANDTRAKSGPFVVTQCHSQSVLSEVKLALSDTVLDPSQLPRITVLARLGLADEEMIDVVWHELDRVVTADHLTSLFVPALPKSAGLEMAELESLMLNLRERCPWDAEQTMETLAPFAVEEANELVESIEELAQALRGDGEIPQVVIDHYCEELGDVIFQVVFHACLAAEEGWFNLADVLRVLSEKLVHRHPHVFPRDDFDSSDLITADDIARNWKRIKNAPKMPSRTSPNAPNTV